MSEGDYAMLGDDDALRDDREEEEERRRRRRRRAGWSPMMILWICLGLLGAGALAGLITTVVLVHRKGAHVAANTTAPTAGPTGAPTTATPTGAPTTSTPTSAPTTPAPTVPPDPCLTCPAFGAINALSVLGGTTVTNTGVTAVQGDVGVYPGTAITGFPPGVITGNFYNGTSEAAAAQLSVDALHANLTACTSPCTNFASGDAAGLTLTPGSYCRPGDSLLVSAGTVTFDGQGNTSAIFRIYIGTTLTMATSTSITLTNGAQPCNVFWIVGSAATLQTSVVFKGVLIAGTSITLVTSASVTGRLIADAAITLDTNVIQTCNCTSV